MSNIQARAPTEAVIPKYVQPKTILSLDVPSDLNVKDTPRGVPGGGGSSRELVSGLLGSSTIS